MIFSVLRLGRYVAKVPHSVVSGFSCGVGAMMIVLQLRSLLGLPAPASGGSEQPLAQLLQVLGQIGSSRGQPLVLGAIVIGTAALLARRWPRSPAALVGVAPLPRRGSRPGLARTNRGHRLFRIAAGCQLHLEAGRLDRHLAGCPWPRHRDGGQHPDHLARGGALSGKAPRAATRRCRRRARRLWHRQPLRGGLRCADECGHPGPQRGQRALRRFDPPVQFPARSGSARAHPVRRRFDRRGSPGGPCWRHRVCGVQPAGVEHLAQAASDAPGRRGRVLVHGRHGACRQRHRRRRGGLRPARGRRPRRSIEPCRGSSVFPFPSRLPSPEKRIPDPAILFLRRDRPLAA